MSEKTETTVAHEGPLQLDRPTMEKRVVHYPDGLREPVLWLADYVDKECRRDLDVLVDNAKRLGIEMDKTTWSRVLRGKLNQNAKGKTTAMLVSEPKLAKAIRALQEEARLKDLAGRLPFVMTSRAHSIFNFIDALRAPERVNKFGIIVGRTGTEKTASLKEIARRTNANRPLAIVYTDAPATPSKTAFVMDLARCYNYRNTSSVPQQRAISDSVNENSTIIVENVQRLYVEKKDADQPVFNFLQKLQEETGCVIVLTLTPVFAEKLAAKLAQGYFEQFIGRAGGVQEFLRLPVWATEEDVLKFAAGAELQHAEKHADALVKLSQEPGLIRVLCGVLQKAKVAANANKEKLTIEHVKEAIGDEGMTKRIFG